MLVPRVLLASGLKPCPALQLAFTLAAGSSVAAGKQHSASITGCSNPVSNHVLNHITEWYCLVTAMLDGSSAS